MEPCQKHDFHNKSTHCTHHPTSPALTAEQRRKRQKNKDQRPRVLGLYALLFEGFRVDGWMPYWEVMVVTPRKVLIVATTILLQQWDVQAQTIVVMIILAIATMMHMYFEPYVDESL